MKGIARREIPALAKRIKADLIVMSNAAETILNQTDCSVLAIKPPGVVSPVTLLD